MKTSSLVHRISAWVLLASLLAPSVAGQEKQSATRWKLKYQAGSAPIPSNQSVNVLVGSEAILLLSATSQEQSIPVTDVTQITFDTARGRYASRAMLESPGMLPFPIDIYECVYVAIPFAIVMLPFKSKRHFVTIEWTEGNRHRAVVLRMKAGTAEGFIAELEQVTKLKARDLDREREEFRQQQKLRQPEKQP